MSYNSKVNVMLAILTVSLIFSYILHEDTLGGAKHDYLFHEKYIILFAENFYETFNNYGKGDLSARNSPVFYIFLSFFYKFGFELNYIRYLNIFSVFFICYLFFGCLKIKFHNINETTLKLFSFVILLSPTIRSLAVWPYPIFYAFMIFLLSIKYYLLFEKERMNNIDNALKSTLYLALASYITPNFCVFSIFFFYKFFVKYKWSLEIKKIIILNFILAAPALLYYSFYDFYLFNVSVREVNDSIKYNFVNKVVIISSIIFFYLLPLIKKKIIFETFISLKKFNKITLVVLLLSICTYFFNFPHGFGGGIFYHFSNKVISNNYFLYMIFIFSFLIFANTKLNNLNNIILFICLMLYNLQTSIYHKYFDPLLLFIFLFLLDFSKTKLKINLLKILKKYYILYFLFLVLSLFKKTI